MEDMCPSIVVQSVLFGAEISWFDRWFDAVLNALVGLNNDCILGRWRIATGGVTAEGALDSVEVGRYQRQAQAAGGDFSYLFLDGDIDYEEAHSRLLDSGDEDLVLVLGANAIVLVSTIARMVRSLSTDGGAVEARRIPLSAPTEHDQAMLETTDSSGPCLLFLRHPLQKSGGSETALIEGDATDRRRGAWQVDQAALRCFGAVFYSTQKPPVLSALPVDRVGGDGGNDAKSGSLLEELMSAAGLRDARDCVAHTLSVTGEPLLSIVMRTQVLRPEALRDVLLCLAGQSDGRFELLLVVHNGDPTEARRILDDQPEWLKLRTRILTSTGGTRSRPLNDGIAAASGSHIAFLDDDDLVFGHWVESFLNASVWSPRSLLRASAGVQRVRAMTWPGEVEGHCNESQMSTPYPVVFDLADHLRVNMTPLMAFAFPRKFFAIFGGADESLEVCEDWDLALRAARVLGVSDVPALTAIYRRWSSGSDSYSLHDPIVWGRDMARVRDKLNAGPILLPAGAASELARLSSLRGVSAELAATYNTSSWRATAPLRAALISMRNLWNRVLALTRRLGS